MPLDVRTAQTTIENALRDTVLYALGRRWAVASVAALRAFKTRGESSSARSSDDLINVEVAGVVTAAYRWDPYSSAADNGTSVIKPNDVTGAGRWVAWTSPIRFAPDVGGPSYYLHELKGGPLESVVVLDKDFDADEIKQLLNGACPAVAIDAQGDSPEDLTFDAGHRSDVRYEFRTYVVAQNLRDGRQAAQGSAVAGESVYGANRIDGLLQALLGGTQIYSVVDGIRVIRAGHGANWRSEISQRRVIRSRDYAVIATVENPQAPNDIGAAEQVDATAHTTDLGESDSYSATDYLVSGIDVSIGAGLVRSITAGSAVLASTPVTYAGQLATFNAESDTYRDLNPNGTITFVSVGRQQTEPAVTPGALRIGVTTTDGSSVIADRIVAQRQALYAHRVTTLS